MRIIPAIFLATVIVITVAFPTPQESKTETDEHALTVKKIDIHVEVKTVPIEKDTPTTALVSEISELLKNPTKSAESLETSKPAEAENPTTAKSSGSESLEVVKTPEALKTFGTETSADEPKPTEVVKESPKAVKNLSKVADTVGTEEEVPAELKDEKSDVKALQTSLDQAVEATSKPKPVIVEASKQSINEATAEAKSDVSEVEKTVPTEPSQTSTVSEPKKTVNDSPKTESVELEKKIVKETEDEVKTAVGETKNSGTSKPKANNDSEEKDSSEEASKETSKELSTKTSEVDNKSTTVETAKAKETSEVKINDEATEAKPDDSAQKKLLPVLAEKNEQQTKSAVEQTVTAVVKDLMNKKQEPEYRTIPVTIVHDNPTVDNIAVKTVPSEEIVQKKEVLSDSPVGNQVPLRNDPVIKTTSATTTASEDASVVVVEPVAVVTAENVEDKLPTVKTTEAEITKPEERKTTTSETKAEDTPEQKEDTPVVFTVEAVKAVQQQDSVKAESPKESIVKTVESVKDEGSSTKINNEDSESSEEKVENSSISRSAVTTTLNDASNKGEVTEVAKELATEQADTTTTATTTTTAPVKSEGKKGKKKLPGSNKKQNTI